MDTGPQKYDWEPVYISAVLETDDRRMIARVLDVRGAIQKRMSQTPPPDAVEQEAITKALAALEILSGERIETL